MSNFHPVPNSDIRENKRHERKIKALTESGKAKVFRCSTFDVFQTVEGDCQFKVVPVAKNIN